MVAQDVTPDLLPELSDADLRELGLASLADRKRLLKAVATEAAGSAGLVVAPPVAEAPGAPAQKPLVPMVALPAAPAAPNDEGERRHATVLSSDLTGYTALNEAFGSQEVEEVMARIKVEASTVIERHGGRVQQFAGDDVTALFGIPVARRWNCTRWSTLSRPDCQDACGVCCRYTPASRPGW